MILATQDFVGINSRGGQHTVTLTCFATRISAFQSWQRQSLSETPLSLWDFQLPGLFKLLFE